MTPHSCHMPLWLLCSRHHSSPDTAHDTQWPWHRTHFQIASASCCTPSQQAPAHLSQQRMPSFAHPCYTSSPSCVAIRKLCFPVGRLAGQGCWHCEEVQELAFLVCILDHSQLLVSAISVNHTRIVHHCCGVVLDAFVLLS